MLNFVVKIVLIILSFLIIKYIKPVTCIVETKLQESEDKLWVKKNGMLGENYYKKYIKTATGEVVRKYTTEMTKINIEKREKEEREKEKKFNRQFTSEARKERIRKEDEARIERLKKEREVKT